MQSFARTRQSLQRTAAVVLSAILLAPLAISQSAATKSSIPADASQRWVDNTSGPFYTSTADVLPGGSFYIEPFFFNYRTVGGSNFSLPMKLAYGVGHKMEFDLTMPTDYTGATAEIPSSLAYGDTVVQLKLELHKETDRYRFRRMPSLGLSFDLNIPTGQLKSAKPNLAGGSQTTNNTWNEQFNISARKQFKPFQLYLEGTEIIQNPTTVTGPYDYNNGLNSIPPGVQAHVIDGNVLAAAVTLEHVLIPKHGFGYLIEMNTQKQFENSAFFGKATAPAFGYVNLSPEIEVTWPATGRFPLTWGGGVTFTAARNNFPRQLTPLFTVTFNGNLHGAR